MVGGGGSGNWHERHTGDPNCTRASSGKLAAGRRPGRFAAQGSSGYHTTGRGVCGRGPVAISGSGSRFSDSRFPTMADTQYTTSTLTDLVRTRSINPAFADGEPSDEREIATRLGTMMRALGMETTEYEPEPGRVSVVGRLPGSGGGRSLMLYGHIDTVGVAAMPEPFSATVRDGKLYGRGAYDMKGGVTACLATVKALRDAGARLLGLRHDPQLFLQPPTASPFNPGDDLHPAQCL